MKLAFFKSVLTDFFDDDAMSHAAAVAFYTTFSFAPLVLLLVTIGGFLGDSTQNDLIRLFDQQLGPRAGDVTKAVVEAAEEEGGTPQRSMWKWAFGLVVLLVTASGVFAQLQAALNRVWEVRAKPTKGMRSFWGWVRGRLLSIGMVFSILFILLASLVLSAIIEWLIPGAAEGKEFVGRAAVWVVSFLVAMVLFAAMFKYLPDVVVPWGDVWFGALVTAVLFTLGKVVLSIYLTEGGVGDRYGQAGAGLIALLVWVYYSCLAVLLGAEVTQQWASDRGSRVRPRRYAEWMEGSMRREESRAEPRHEDPPSPDGVRGVAPGPSRV